MANKKKGARTNRSAASASLTRLEQALPKRLADYVGQLQTRLDRLEKQISAAQNAAMRQATRLLRDASRQLGQLEERGETAWQRLGARYRKEAARLLRRLEETLVPLTQSARPAPSKKAVRRAKSGSRKKTAARTSGKARKRKKTATKNSGTKAATRKSAKRKSAARKSSKRGTGRLRRSSR